MVLLCSATVCANCLSNVVIVSSVLNLFCPLDATKLRKTTGKENFFSKKNSPRRGDGGCLLGFKTDWLELFGQGVEGAVGTTVVVVLPSDGLGQILVLVLDTTAEAEQIVLWLEQNGQVVVL